MATRAPNRRGAGIGAGSNGNIDSITISGAEEEYEDFDDLPF